MKTIFITGTGTDVGKTVVAAALATGLHRLGQRVLYWKPIQTGVDPSTNQVGDTDFVISHSGIETIPSEYVYEPPLSPDQAAKRSNRPAPRFQDLCATLDAIRKRFDSSADCMLIEGAGGLIVPINDLGYTWLDLIKYSSLPVLVAAKSGLGTLNHSSLTMERLAIEGCTSLGLVLSGARHEDNEASLRVLLRSTTILHLPETPSFSKNSAWDDTCKRFAEDIMKSWELPREPDWGEWDRNHVWHPYTQHQLASAPIKIAAARGAWLVTADGRRLLDGISSWWVNTMGHGRPEIGEAISRQQRLMDHVVFAGATHRPGAQLATELVELADKKLDRVFYSDNGSTAVEVGLKMAYQAWTNRGETQRTKFVGFRGSYHGDTFGAMAVAASEGFHGAYRPLLFETIWADPVTSHKSAVCPKGSAALAERLKAFAALLDSHQHQLAGVILEPLVQGAGGMLVQPIEFVKEVQNICRAHHLPLILDEVFSGMGRTGDRFAFRRVGIEPDIVCLAKGLTGGALPLAVTLAKEEFFKAFLSEDKNKALLHGHSFTGNPIACSAALAALDIFREENLPARAKELEETFQTWIDTVGVELKVANPRAIGGILAMELPGSGFGDYFDKRAAAIPETAARWNLFLRPLGNTVYFAPPLTIEANEIAEALRGIEATISTVTST